MLISLLLQLPFIILNLLLITSNGLTTIRQNSESRMRDEMKALQATLTEQNRRKTLSSLISFLPMIASSQQAGASSAETKFQSEAYQLREYDKSLMASRDTQISPFEAYDTMKEAFSSVAPHTSKLYNGKSNFGSNMRALDLGAGAGASTQVLFELGYQTIDAVDWSSKAWDKYVLSAPSSVQFYEMDADTFLQLFLSTNKMKYNVISINFAINEPKAIRFAKEMLVDSNDSLLLAPVNIQRDYWFKQTYRVYDCKGKVRASFGDVVGVWNVMFQPDVTEDTCQGPWCAPFNGYQKKKL